MRILLVASALVVLGAACGVKGRPRPPVSGAPGTRTSTDTSANDG